MSIPHLASRLQYYFGAVVFAAFYCSFSHALAVEGTILEACQAVVVTRRSPDLEEYLESHQLSVAIFEILDRQPTFDLRQLLCCFSDFQLLSIVE